MAAVSSVLAGAALATTAVTAGIGYKEKQDAAKAQKKAAKQSAAEIQALAEQSAAQSSAAAAPVNENTGSVFRLGSDAASAGSRRGRRSGRGAVAPFIGNLASGAGGLRVR